MTSKFSLFKGILLFLYRLSVNLLSFLLIQLPLQLIGIILLYPVCAVYPIGAFPALLRWFDSADPYVGRDTSVIRKVQAQSLYERYNWVAFRNPINYFAYKYLGFRFPEKTRYTLVGNLDVGDSTGDEPGYRYLETDKGYYEYLYVKRIGLKSCFYFRLGWKLGGLKNKPGSYCQQVFTISYRSYSGV